MPAKNAPTVASLRAALRAVATPERAEVSARYFKTGKGEYGEGDVFIGVAVPDLRKIVRAHRGLTLADVETLLGSRIHEERLAAALLMVDAFGRAKRDPAARERIYETYLRRIDRIDSWDIVDSSAPHIVGAWLFDRDRSVLDRLAASERLWTRRVAMLATQYFIRKGESDDALRIAELLVDDTHDLMHKAVGWMLREIGEHVGLPPLRGFLRTHAATMPRTMLRYAIEKLDEDERAKWMGARAKK